MCLLFSLRCCIHYLIRMQNARFFSISVFFYHFFCRFQMGELRLINSLACVFFTVLLKIKTAFKLLFYLCVYVWVCVCLTFLLVCFLAYVSILTFHLRTLLLYSDRTKTD